MMKILLLVSALLILAHGKRLTDHGRLPRMAGGGLLSRRAIAKFAAPTHAKDGDDALLLQTDPAPLPAEYSTVKEFPYCYERKENDQGECNSCWAFAVRNSLRSTACVVTKRAQDLNPLGMICFMQRGGLCEARAVTDALDFLDTQGMGTDITYNARIREMGIREQFQRLGARPTKTGTISIDRKKVVVGVSEYVAEEFDPSNPRDEICRDHADTFRGVKQLRASGRALTPGSLDWIRRNILKTGNVIATMRLTWQFVNFSGSLFNPPRESLTFCRLYERGDTDDFCDPSKMSPRDRKAAIQQRRPENMSQDEWEETWYNHFVTIHGWGQTASGVKYWLVENSWGSIYDVDDDSLIIRNWENRTIADGIVKTHFVKIAESVAGRGGLEMTSRHYFDLRKIRSALTFMNEVTETPLGL